MPRNYIIKDGVTVKFWIGIGSVLLGAISLFNLTRRYFQVGLSEIFSKWATFYEAIFHTLAGLLNETIIRALGYLNITFPKIPNDMIIIYILIGAARYRAWGTGRGVDRIPNLFRKKKHLGWSDEEYKQFLKKEALRRAKLSDWELFKELFKEKMDVLKIIIRWQYLWPLQKLVYSLVWPVYMITLFFGKKGSYSNDGLDWLIELFLCIIGVTFLFALNAYSF
jgi:uncharacterized protein YnzC (UPF0291/DUF896 family)